MYRVGLTQRHFRFTRVLKGQILCSRLTFVTSSYPRCAYLCLLTNCLTSDLKANYDRGVICAPVFYVYVTMYQFLPCHSTTTTTTTITTITTITTNTTITAITTITTETAI